VLIDVAIPEDRNVIKKEAEVLVQRTYNRNSAHVECERKSDTDNNRDDWTLFKITQTIPEEHTRHERN
jgi:hypothetical protein